MHTTISPPAALEPLPVRRRKFTQKNPGQYRVTTRGEEPRQVAASSAYEAFKLSGLKSAIKIERWFNPLQIIFGETQVQDEAETSEAETPEEVVHSKLTHLQRTHPVVSADDLDTIMRYAREGGGEPAAKAEPAPMTVPPPLQPPADAPLQAHGAPAASTIVPTSTAQQTTTTNPAGVEVHEDGFDELIPASAPIRHPAAKSADSDSAGSLATSSAALPPAQELSLEEVEKLLGGKE